MWVQHETDVIRLQILMGRCQCLFDNINLRFEKTFLEAVREHIKIPSL